MDMEYDSTDDRLQTVDISDLSFQLQRLLFYIVVPLSIHRICHNYPRNVCKFFYLRNGSNTPRT